MHQNIDISDFVRDGFDILSVGHALYIYWGLKPVNGEADCFHLDSPRNPNAVAFNSKGLSAKIAEGMVDIRGDFPPGKTREGFLEYLEEYLALTSDERKTLWVGVYTNRDNVI